ncbi:hypothetical protein [Modestobacter sp. SYSU DS0290]
MALSARTMSTVDAVGLLDDTTAADQHRSAGDEHLVCPDAAWSDTVVVHVQLRPRRSATRRCLAALTALAARHETVAFALTGLSGDARAVRVTVGVELGPRDQIARFSTEAQAAYAFVDALFTDLYDFMPVYVGEPSEAERVAAAGVLDAVGGGRTPAPRSPMPRIPTPRTPSSVTGAAVAGLRGIPVPA